MVFKVTRFDDSSMRVSTDGVKINDEEKRANQQRRIRKKIGSKGKGNSRECGILAVIQREGNQLSQMLLMSHAK